MTAAVCGACRWQVRWVTSENGRYMPIDPRPRPDGNVVLVADTPGGSEIAHVLHKGEDPTPGVQRFMHHAAVCPKRRRENTKTSG